MPEIHQKNSEAITTPDSLASHPTCILLRSVFKKTKMPMIIGIAGDSGTGKTTYSNGIRRLLGPDMVKTITMDGYHTEDRATRAKTGHLPLDPAINNLKLFKKHLKALKQGKTIKLPIYSHRTGTFKPPVSFTPSSIIIVEGLHALYPEFLPYLDFTIYVDPCREIKWKWKKARDLKKRGHQAEKLEKEMLAREAAYKRWIDFQKTSANVVIKIFPSRMMELARYDLINFSLADHYKVELIMEPAKKPLPTLPLPFDLASMMNICCPPFMLAAVPCKYWGREVMIVHIDGVLSKETVAALESHIVSCTGISPEKALNEAEVGRKDKEERTATQFAQLLIAWRFLEQVNQSLGKIKNQSGL